MRAQYASVDDAIRATFRLRPEWFESKVLARLSGYPDARECWTWPIKGRAYGMANLPVDVGYGAVYTHRVVWLALRGPIPKGYALDHDGDGCRNKACANPAHLAVVTPAVNAFTGQGLAAVNASKTHCPRGHLLADENLVAAAMRRGRRNCRTCQRTGANRQAAAIRSAARMMAVSIPEYIRRHGHSVSVAERIVAERGGQA